MKNNKMVYMIVGAVVLVVIISLVVMNRRSTQTQTNQDVLQNEPTIAPVDSSVEVSLTPAKGKKEVTLKVTHAPMGTQSIEYQLSYEERTKGLQGAVGMVTVDGDSSTVEKNITLGTCSSGTCVYHDVVGSIQLELKFSGTYGERAFSKEYSL